ncbi:MAG TPA: bifunctional diaminohydroxyphosphoribosylaminopyrimidine deaminase/5-amino-6-(5-phosphoribosylamino)uracil reductase RibD [Candidatus Hydrogenedentes bacterium]|nr:bifunctional diaminohydroxyphosphoribosylaminopyrimidine deaminase/5-amino-6-(5-phosphoribosylamino)uracil reductase RibD [Candidatus Hydrogenedentota bacterium]
MTTDERYMSRALDLAARRRGWTSPNPMVGCVVVRDRRIIGEGYHERAGAPHAEVNAIRAAGDIGDATLYVTLEPCCFHGKTPPCSDLIIEGRPARVVVAMLDPNPRVSGAGIRQLREAGIGVEVGVLEVEAQRLNEAYIAFITTGRPFVIAKCGMSLDGKIATRNGDSHWVTCEASRRRVHELRHEVDAILVGSRTVNLDDPSLTTRLDAAESRDPVRVILDADGCLDRARRVFHLESEAPTWVALPEGRTFDGADETLHLPRSGDGVDMAALMDALGARAITSVLIEGGGATHASAFAARVVDKVLFFIAPKIIGGRDAITPVEGDGAERMADVVHLESMCAEPVGEDILIEAYVRKEQCGCSPAS